ncbi:MAG TPA: hydantoinase/oxoprolinase family protein [Hyphomicrobiaceae bacterium]|nr:hydantoinase/oxoprolinase family protein [Hyphomicrobiaceae bacterium]
MTGTKPVRVAVDIGGTFTDLQVHDQRTGWAHAFKTPSTPGDPSEGLINGLKGAAHKFGFALDDIGLILHGSTIATNAVLERKLPKGAMITTAGFRDVLEIGRHIRKNVYALRAEARALLIPRHLRFEVDERVRADGTVELAMDEEQLLAIAGQLKAENVRTVAVMFLHGYRNPVHEARAAELLGCELPEVAIATSHGSSPEIREYERASTTVLNALLMPVISGYLERVAGRLAAAGIAAPLYLVQSNGGVASPDEAARMPAKLLLSGPAGGAMAMADLARRHGLDNLVGFDMGGTSSDVSVVIDGVVGQTAESSIDGLPVRLPMIEIRTIGAGGGSLARIEAGALRVGPESAGAVPGPVCYGRGGTEPAVTDANATLGRLDPEGFLGGGMRLAIEMSAAAIDSHVARPLGLEREAAADGILDIATAHMAGAIRLSLFEKGADPADFSLAPFGGAAGLHACAVADELSINRIIFPADASTLSARGILFADLRHDLSRSQLMLLGPEAIAPLREAVCELRAEGHRVLEGDCVAPQRRRIEFACDLRYRGQAYEIVTGWSELDGDGLPDAAALAALMTRFHNLHQARFAHSAPKDPVELVTVRAIAIGLLDKPSLADDGAPRGMALPDSVRRVLIDGQWRDIPVYDRRAVLSGAAAGGKAIEGPALIGEDYTVLLIAGGWRVRPASYGDLMCDRVEGKT